MPSSVILITHSQKSKEEWKIQIPFVFAFKKNKIKENYHDKQQRNIIRPKWKK